MPEEKSTELSDRVKQIIENAIPAYRRNKQLEEQTGIPADRWNAFNQGRQRPTAEMIQGIGTAFPQLSLWIVTGQSDPGGGQYDLQTYLAMRQHKIGDIVRKENPSELSESELLVVRVEHERASYIGKIEKDLVDMEELDLFEEARAKGRTRGEVLKERRLTQDAIEEFLIKQNPSYAHIKALEKNGLLGEEIFKLLDKKSKR